MRILKYPSYVTKDLGFRRETCFRYISGESWMMYNAFLFRPLQSAFGANNIYDVPEKEKKRHALRQLSLKG